MFRGNIMVKGEIKRVKTSVEKFEDFFSSDMCKDQIFNALEDYPDQKSLKIDYVGLDMIHPDLADLLINKPEEVLKAAQKAIHNIDPLRKNAELEILIDNLPTSRSLNHIKSDDIGHLISFKARIVKADKIRPRINVAVFECRSCMRLHEVLQNGLAEIVNEPFVCQECGGRKFRLLENESKFIDYQDLILEGTSKDETRQFRAIVEGSLVEYDEFKEDEIVDVVSVPKFMKKNNRNDMFLKINNIKVDIEAKLKYQLPDEDENKVLDFIKSLEPEPGDYHQSGVKKYEIYLLMGSEYGLSEKKTDEILKNLISKDHIYRPKAGQFRVVLTAEVKEELKKINNNGRTPKSDRDKFRIVVQLIKQLEDEYGGKAPKQLLIDELGERFDMDEEKVGEVLRFLRRNGTIFEPKQGYFKVI